MSRVRSPAYPSLGLRAAIDMIRKVHTLQQKTPEPRDVVLKHMGYSGANGRALKSISALIKYGFLEKTNSGGLCVSDGAIKILYPDDENPEAHKVELVLASKKPELFNEIFSRWETRPSESSLESYLIRQGFNVNAIGEVTRAFYETYDLVSDLPDEYNSHSEVASNQDEDEKLISANEELKPLKSQPPTTQEAKPLVSNDDRLNVTKPIFDFETVQILTEINNQKDLAELISRLEQIKPMLPESTGH